ncbi:transcription factor [Schizosaccharomyces cryophilus OY26]|uniref:Transcription factor n=1 Tax=Schizosaccharomyces cryophilus (strain OY26 / ATCC MYA-4695 / CBS 11777 / NBRC 106824 / NRRL Y48691) TaxID=653667 RepID=S9XAJ4_SCHCR|nr:transcription factor [Schizosaccharomyces cryophilus OY26]EPY50781.1 transcription factor [Schizosaccharomyces cryophilus OY26]
MESSKVTPKKMGQTTRRAIHSCLACRKKKLKCDHGRPCSNCKKRATTYSCIYLQQGQPSTNNFDGGNETDSVINELLSRISHLEHMLGELNPRGSSQDSASAPLTPVKEDSAAFDETERNIGTLSLRDSTKTTYVNYPSSYHLAWHLRKTNSLNLDHDFSEDGKEVTQESFLFRLPVREHARNFLPPKHISDLLIEAYFLRCHLFIPVLHKSTFMERYKVFWEEPAERKPAMTSLLFAMFASALLATPIETRLSWNLGEEEKYLSVDYHLAFRYALASSNFLFDPDLNALRALIICQVAFDSDTTLAPPSMVGLITQTAYFMGLHRDGSLYGLNSVYAEIRRRVWFSVLVLDLRVSEMTGIPPRIHEDSYDTSFPSLLPEENYQADPSIFTAGRFVCISGRASREVSKYMRMLLGLKSPNYSKILEMDQKLTDYYKEIKQELLPEPTTVHERLLHLFTTYIFQRFPILFHFPFLLKKGASAFSYSRIRSVECALDALSCLYELGTTPEFSMYSWFFWRYPPFHPCIVLFLDILHSEQTIYSDDKRVVMINQIFSLFPKITDIQRFHQAWSLLKTSRTHVWEKLGLKSSNNLAVSDENIPELGFLDPSKLDISWDDWDAIFQHCPF